MPLNSSSVISGCRRWYSGKCLYLSNSRCHSWSVVGGSDPCGRQSVIERPERVRRVTPPSTTMPKTAPLQPRSHQPSCAGGEGGGRGGGGVGGAEHIPRRAGRLAHRAPATRSTERRACSRLS
eukprot:scaffold152984_cov35-Tisochrysis_lutea.AAC.5